MLQLPKCSLFPLLFLALLGCGKAESHSHGPVQQDVQAFTGEYPIDVLCTTGQVAEIARRVGGEYLRVTALMDHDVDPHLFKPRHNHVEQLNSADVIFYSGLHLEGRLSDLLVRRARTSPTYAVTEGLQTRSDKRLREPPEFEGMYDPHVWHDVSLWADCVHDVADMLGKLDPKHAADYDKQAHQYMDELSALHQYCKDEIAKIPAESRVLVTAHDAFGYFGKAYGLEVIGLKGISSEEEKDLAHQEEVQKMTSESMYKDQWKNQINSRRTPKY